jgi:prepilin-type N-terminal cleavage/methylation domain-containing protein
MVTPDVSARRERGFTLVEVVLAVMLLGIGVMALLMSSAMVTRMIGEGRQYTLVSQRASARFERLRQMAASTAAPCTAPAFKTDSAVVSGIHERWVVPASGAERVVTVYLRYARVKGPRVDTVSATILCQ